MSLLEEHSHKSATCFPIRTPAVIHYLYRTADLLPCTTSLTASVFLWVETKCLGFFLKKRDHEPWPFLCRHIWCMYNLSIQGWLRDPQGWSQVHTVFIVCSGLHITHSVQLLRALARYMRHICITLTIAVLWFPTQAHWSHIRPPVWWSEWIMDVQSANMYIHLDMFSPEKQGFCIDA